MSATTTTARTSAQLSRTGFAPCTCRLGSGIMTCQEASEMVHSGMSAPLAITNAKGETGFYWLSVNRCGDEVLGYRLTSDDQAGVMYDLPASLDHCECKDFAYRRRECKHLRVVKALKSRKLIP